MDMTLELIIYAAILLAGFATPPMLQFALPLALERYYSFRGRDMLRIRDRPLWRQPAGILLASFPVIGATVFFSSLGCFTWRLMMLDGSLTNGSASFPEIALFVYTWGAFLGSVWALVLLIRVHLSGTGPSHRYTAISRLLKRGCSCGARGLVTGAVDTECAACGKVLHSEKPSGRGAAFGTNLIEASILIDASREAVYDYLLSPPSKACRENFSIASYEPSGENGWLYRQKGIETRVQLVEARRPEYIHTRFRTGTDARDRMTTLTDLGGRTCVDVMLAFPYPVSKRAMARIVREGLEFNRREIESQAG